MRVLILRPAPGATATARLVAQAGCEPVPVALFEVAPIAWTLPDRAFDALVMTSANAARHGGARLAALRHLPLFVVGDATAAAARAAGFERVTVGDGDADDIARLLDADLDPGARVLHLCGTKRRALPTRATVTELPVYTLVPRGLDAAEHQALAEGQVALVHAASAGARLGELMPPGARDRMHIVAISDRAAAACGIGWRSIAVAAQPRQDAMLELVAALCDTKR